ncbi:hypothetical protein LPJ73_005322 [Coemansia sp. RSA 2703]|nr:hypothetical protein LPJ73_005322 [Coemansia sp. RSA 2703]KAJ2371713.1 hypothetical protein IW150_004467 [Coemansia sp. RSA 2607]KAJ2392719.1 hypothetical protein GGI05_002601 [Coemansia sp. RSA 2603]
MQHVRLLFISAVIAMLLALVHGVPAGEAHAPSASAAVMASPGVEIIVQATPAPTHVAASVPSSGSAAHLTLGQVVFNFVSGMLTIIGDTVNGYLQFGPSHV